MSKQPDCISKIFFPQTAIFINSKWEIEIIKLFNYNFTEYRRWWSTSTSSRSQKESLFIESLCLTVSMLKISRSKTLTLRALKTGMLSFTLLGFKKLAVKVFFKCWYCLDFSSLGTKYSKGHSHLFLSPSSLHLWFLGSHSFFIQHIDCQESSYLDFSSALFCHYTWLVLHAFVLSKFILNRK